MASVTKTYKTIDNVSVTVTLSNANYSGTIPDFDLAGEPILRYDSDGDGFTAPIRRTSLEITVIPDDINTMLEVIDENLTCTLEVSTYGYTFKGYFFGDGVEYSELDLVKSIKLVFVDTLGMLKEKKITDINSDWLHLDSSAGGNTLLGFRYQVKRLLSLLIPEYIDGFDIFGGDYVYDEDGTQITGLITVIPYTDDTATLDAAYIDVSKLFDGSVYDVLKELCLALNYYATIYNNRLVIIHINTILNKTSGNYRAYSMVNGSLTCVNTALSVPSPKVINIFTGYNVLSYGRRNITVKSDYGATTNIFETVDEIFRDDLRDTINGYANAATSCGLFKFYTSTLITANIEDGKIRIYKNTMSSSSNRMYNYILIPLCIDTVSIYDRINIKIKIISSYGGEQYFPAVVVKSNNVSQTANYVIQESHPENFFKIFGDMFSGVGTASGYEHSVNFWVTPAGNETHISLAFCPCYSVNGSETIYYDTIITDINITTDRHTIIKGEEVDIINSASLKSKETIEIKYGSPNYIHPTAIYTPQYYYRNNIMYKLEKQGYYYGDATNKYKLNEYIGRIIAAVRNSITHEVDIEYRQYNVLAGSGTIKYNALYNSLIDCMDRLIVPLSGEFNLITGDGKLRGVTVGKAANIITEGGDNVITEDSNEIVKEKIWQPRNLVNSQRKQA
jgi:hypothetical protein